MALENFSRMGKVTFDQTYAVIATAPSAIVDPSTGNVIGWIPGTARYQSVSSSNPVSLMSGQRESFRTPGFNSKNRPLLLPSKPFDYYKQESSSYANRREWSTYSSVQQGPGTSSFVDTKSFWTNQSFPFLPNVTAQWLATLRPKATANLLKNLRDSSFNAAQAVAERKQTAGLVSSTATRVAKSLRNLRRGNFSKAASDLGIAPRPRAVRRFNSEYIVDQSKAIGNGWLELQYGWKPLLSDVYGSMETLAKANNSGNPNTIFKKATGRASRSEQKTNRIDRLDHSSFNGTYDTIQTATCRASVRTGVTYSLSSAPLASLASVGISNPALLAWELLPYSFVVDWFLPIGNYLESLDATNGLTFLTGYVTVFTSYEASTFDTIAYSSKSGTMHYYGYGEGKTKYVTCTRSTIGAFPSMPFPSFKNPLSTSHVASAMALLLQLKR